MRTTDEWAPALVFESSHQYAREIFSMSFVEIDDGTPVLWREEREAGELVSVTWRYPEDIKI